MSLDRRTILVVEDESLIALDLADTVAAAGGIVAGPVATVADGLELLAAGGIDGAICDAMLADRNVTPLVLALVDRGIPVVIHSATGPPAALAAILDLPVVRKPAVADRVIAALAAAIAQARR